MSTENATVVTTDGTTTTHQSPQDEIDGGSFFLGVFVAVAVLLIRKFVMRRHARLADERREPARFAGDYAELAERTATLERIVTEPTTRLTREIDALR